jgi:RNA polymerase sigma factor (sigma-70 family)
MCRSLYPRLVGQLSLYCGDNLVAEELAQETLVRLCRDWKKVRDLDHPEAWAFRVAINLGNSLYRRRAAERSARARMEGSVHRPQHADATEQHALVSALKKLPHKQRAALVLRFYGDQTFAEIGRTLDIPEPTAKSLVRRGLQRLREDPAVPGVEDVSLA